MATRPPPTPEWDPTHKKTDPTGTAETSVKQPILRMISSASKGPALQQLALELTLQGTKYRKDDDLNKSSYGSR